MMKTLLHNRRYSIFLVSFMLMLFGDIFVKREWDYDTQTILILQNMLFSVLLFKQSAKLKKFILLLIVCAIFTRVYYQYQSAFTGYPFLIVYSVYFLLISYRIYADLMFQKELGIETISAAFSGYILLGTVFSILFITMGSSGAFKGPEGIVSHSDYLYFSFVTLLTIGYGDIVPITEFSKKIIILLGLTGNFYTVFVVGIVIGKFLNRRVPELKND